MAGIDPSSLPGRREHRHLATWSACGLLIAAAVVVNQSAVHWRPNVVDSHLFAYHGWCVSQGARPYLDIWDNKPPGIWWANAAGFWLTGDTVSAELLISALALTAALGAFVAIARLAYRPSLTVPAAVLGGILLTHLTYECGANRTETLVLTCETLAVLGYLCWWRRGGLGWLVLAGLAAGAAPFFKQSGLATGVACALHLGWTQLRAGRADHGDRPRGLKPAALQLCSRSRGSRWKPWLVAGGAFAVAPLAVALTLFAQGALGQAWQAVGSFNRAYFAMDRALRIYAPVLKPLAGLFAAAAVGLVWALLPRRSSHLEPASEGKRRAPVLLFWLWFLLAAYLACVGPGRRGHHFMPVLPALGLLALYPLHRLAAPRGLIARLSARPTSVVVLVLCGYVLVQLGASNAVELARCWQVKPHWYALSYARPRDYQIRAAAIRRLTQPGDRIYVWGWSPGTYRYAQRPAASRFATFEKIGQVGAHAQFIFDEATADLRRSPPKAIYFSSEDLRRLLDEPRSAFAEWLAERYEDQGVIGGMHLLIRRDDPPSHSGGG